MTTFIRDVRKQQGLSLRELGERLGVTPGAVSQYESSEAAETIRIATLVRALTAMGASYRPAVSIATSKPEDRREVRLNLALHRAVAKKLLEDPDAVTSIAIRNVPKIRANVFGRRPESLVDEWESLLHGPTGPLIAALLDESEHGIDLRQNSPFAGALTTEERLSVIAGPR